MFRLENDMSIYLSCSCMECKHYTHNFFTKDCCVVFLDGFPSGWMGPSDEEKDTFMCNSQYKWEPRTEKQKKKDAERNKKHRELYDKCFNIARRECHKFYGLDVGISENCPPYDSAIIYSSFIAAERDGYLEGIFSLNLERYKKSEIFDIDYYEKIKEIGKLKIRVYTKDFDFKITTFPY